jgi:hypothetical protein
MIEAGLCALANYDPINWSSEETRDPIPAIEIQEIR